MVTFPTKSLLLGYETWPEYKVISKSKLKLYGMPTFLKAHMNLSFNVKILMPIN